MPILSIGVVRVERLSPPPNLTRDPCLPTHHPNSRVSPLSM